MVVAKEVLRPGIYYPPDGKVEVTPARIAHWVRQFRKMKAAGLPVPVPWEHQDHAVPERIDPAQSLADKAKHNAGFVSDLFVADDGSLWANLDIGNPQDVQQIVRNVRFVSPQLDLSFRDGDGRVWSDVITHLALTARPVVHRQRPFGDPPQRLSRVRLSLTQLGSNTMPNDLLPTDATDTTDVNDATDTTAGPQSPEEYLAEVRTLLEQLDIHLPEHTTNDTFLRDLSVALHALVARENEADETTGEPDNVNPDAGDQGATREPSPTMMSLQRQLQQLQEQNSSLLTDQRIARLTRFEREGRVSPQRANELRQEYTRRRLSLGRGGEQVAVLDARLEEIGRIPKGTFSPGGARLSHTGAQPAQRSVRWEDTAEVTPERGQQVADEFCRNTGIR